MLVKVDTRSRNTKWAKCTSEGLKGKYPEVEADILKYMEGKNKDTGQAVSIDMLYTKALKITVNRNIIRQQFKASYGLVHYFMKWNNLKSWEENNKVPEDVKWITRKK